MSSEKLYFEDKLKNDITFKLLLIIIFAVPSLQSRLYYITSTCHSPLQGTVMKAIIFYYLFAIMAQIYVL
jgi:hypothetical protein